MPGVIGRPLRALLSRFGTSPQFSSQDIYPSCCLIIGFANSQIVCITTLPDFSTCVNVLWISLHVSFLWSSFRSGELLMLMSHGRFLFSIKNCATKFMRSLHVLCPMTDPIIQSASDIDLGPFQQQYGSILSKRSQQNHSFGGQSIPFFLAQRKSVRRYEACKFSQWNYHQHGWIAHEAMRCRRCRVSTWLPDSHANG